MVKEPLRCRALFIAQRNAVVGSLRLHKYMGMWVLRRSGNLKRSRSGHRITQQPPPSPFSKVRSAARVAASKTSSTPSPVKDEHSRYFRAPISWAISDASLLPTKCCDFFRISSIATGSSRRSFFNPTRIIGTPGHLSLASSTH